MDVLHIVSGNLYGGVEAMLATLAKYRTLAPEMHPKFAVCFSGRLSEELTLLGAAPRLLGNARASRPWSVLKARRTLSAYLREQRPDAAILHGAWSAALLGPVLRRADVPCALFVHDVARGRHWVERWARLNPPDALIANSHFTAASTPSLYPRLQPSVYYCPVPTRAPESGEREQVRAELGVGPNEVVILQASRMQAWKGQREHLLSLAKLKELPGWVSFHAGGPQRPAEVEYFNELQRLASSLGIQDRVKFLGQRQDVPRLLSAADVYLQPNLGPEPFGIALIEAMLAGLPVVTFQLGGPAEFVTNEVGVAVPPGGDLVTPLARLIQSATFRDELGSRAKSHAQHLCDPATQLPALSRLLSRSLLSCGF